MKLPAALAYLDDHVNLEATAGWVHGLSLDHMRALAHVLGDPQHAYPVIHVTGTNGKGSVTRMTAALLQATGLSVGAYTSPHLERLNERLAWNGEPIDDEQLGEQIGAVAAVEELAGVRPSYFEILTGAAFRWFADLAVDVAVIEVGLLGRYDATNVASAQVAVVTNVGLDHTDGATGWRVAVASEKAGIIEHDSHLVLGESDPDLQAVFAAEGPATTWVRGTDFDCDVNRVAVGGRVVDLRTPSGTVEDLYLPVHGAHQGDNAAVALASVEAFFGGPIDEELVTEAFGQLHLPGRFEVVRRDPTVVLDGAHNLDGARAAAGTLAEEFMLAGSVVIVIGLLRGRDPSDMLEALGATEAGFVVACTPPSPRAIPAEEVAAAAEHLGIAAEAVADVGSAVSRALAVATDDDLVLVSGSLYVVGEARRSLSSNEGDRMTTTTTALKANDLCWCGSGKKYKRCHKIATNRIRPGTVSPRRAVPADIPAPHYATTGARSRRGEPMVKDADTIDRMRRTGTAAAEILREVGAAVAPGVTTDELDVVCHEACLARGGYPSPLNYGAFPKSVCTSVNEVICHGIPDDRALVEGDIVNIDVTLFREGVHGDTNATFFVGSVDHASAHLVATTRACLEQGLAAVVPGRPISDIGRAIEECANEQRLSVVRAFIGHGVGTEFHTAPEILHYYDPRASTVMRPGMTFTVEPMIAQGSWQHRMWDDDWTAVTIDGRRSAQFEHSIVVTESGAEVLTLHPDGAWSGD